MNHEDTQKPPRVKISAALAFLWFHKFPRLQSFCRKEVRRGSLWWEQERRRSIMYFKPIFFHFLLYLATFFSVVDIFDQEFRQICFQYMKVHFMEGPRLNYYSLQ